MVDGFGANPDELRNTASKISDIVHGINAGDLAQAGGDAAAFGHDGVAKAFADFCSGVDAAVQVMVQTSESASKSLHETAQNYVRQDDAAQQPMNQVGAQLPGGP
jgi:hypothetical protein